MYFDYLQLLLPVLCLAVDASAQVATFRLFPKFGLLKSEYVGLCAGFLTLLLFEAGIFLQGPILLTESIFLFTANAVIYLSGAYMYFTFLNLGETARRVRILRELYDAKGALSPEEILRRYNAKMILEKRIERLVNNGQIALKSGKYYIASPVMLILANIIVFLKSFILGKKSEFD